jgi:hypothetical protein
MALKHRSVSSVAKSGKGESSVGDIGGYLFAKGKDVQAGRRVYDTDDLVSRSTVFKWQEERGFRSAVKQFFTGGEPCRSLVARDLPCKAVDVECYRLIVSPALKLETHLAVPDCDNGKSRVAQFTQFPHSPHVDHLQLCPFAKQAEISRPDSVAIGGIQGIQLASLGDCNEEFLEAELITV